MESHCFHLKCNYEMCKRVQSVYIILCVRKNVTENTVRWQMSEKNAHAHVYCNIFSIQVDAKTHTQLFNFNTYCRTVRRRYIFHIKYSPGVCSTKIQSYFFIRTIFQKHSIITKKRSTNRTSLAIDSSNAITDIHISAHTSHLLPARYFRIRNASIRNDPFASNGSVKFTTRLLLHLVRRLRNSNTSSSN